MRSLSSRWLLAAALASAGIESLNAEPPAPGFSDGVIPAQPKPSPTSQPIGSPTPAAKPIAPLPQPADPVASPTPAPYDEVGYATSTAETTVAHATLPPGSYVEVTALDSGRTLLVPVGRIAGQETGIELPAAVAEELGLTPGQAAAVRVRVANPSPTDLAALQAGKPGAARPDAPPVLLMALWHKLAGLGSAAAPTFVVKPTPAVSASAQPPLVSPAEAATVRPSPAALGKAATVKPVARQPARPTPVQSPVVARSTPASAATSHAYYVQLASFSDARRAGVMANAVGGRVSRSGSIHRVQLGPFTDPRFAQAARDAVARRGYGDATVVRD